MTYKGIAMYDERNRKVLDLCYDKKKGAQAIIWFAGVPIDVSTVVDSFVRYPCSYSKMSRDTWKAIIKEVEYQKQTNKSSGIFTRLENGDGYKVLRNRMNYMLNVVYNNWYTSEVINEFEKNGFSEFRYDSSYYRRIN